MNSHSTRRHLKHSTNLECAENVQSSNVVECEWELRHIPTYFTRFTHTASHSLTYHDAQQQRSENIFYSTTICTILDFIYLLIQFRDASSVNVIVTGVFTTRMWANAQRDGRPAKHRWRPLFNAAEFG